MKKAILLGLCISTTCGAHTQVQRFPLPAGNALHITFINDNDHTIMQYNQALQSTTVAAPAKPPTLSCHQNNARFWSSHPWLTGIGMVACGYGALLAYLLYAQHTMAARDSWSSWKGDVALEALRQLPAQQLARELFGIMQARYKNVPEAHFLTPLIYFMHDADCELTSLNRFVTVKGWCGQWCVAALLPAQQEALALAHDKMARLAFYKDLVLAWITEYSGERAPLVCV